MPIKLNGATSGSVELDVPATVSGGDVTLTLPNGVGSNKQVITSDGAGTLSFARHGVINATYYNNSTRGVLATTNNTLADLVSFSVNKISSSSSLVFFGSIPGFNETSGSTSMVTKYGTTQVQGGWNWQYTAGAYLKIGNVGGSIVGHTTTGSQDLKLCYFADNNTTGQRPFQVINPNATDDERLGGTGTQIVVLEVEL